MGIFTLNIDLPAKSECYPTSLTGSRSGIYSTDSRSVKSGIRVMAKKKKKKKKERLLSVYQDINNNSDIERLYRYHKRRQHIAVS